VRRLARYTFNAFTMLSLLVCIAVTVTSIRGKRKEGLIGYGRGKVAMWILSDNGRVGGAWAWAENGGGNFGQYMDESGKAFVMAPQPYSLAMRWLAEIEDLTDMWDSGHAGFLVKRPRWFVWHGIICAQTRGYSDDFNVGPVQYFLSARAGKTMVTTVVMMIPCWILVAGFATLPVVWSVGYWRRTGRRVGDGCCVNCAYDLRATPNRCPECGTVPEEAKA
jgi:hypothetical protein